MRDAFCQDLCCSALLLVIVPLCEQHTFTGTLAVTQACCQAVVCTAALVSAGCTWQHLCCSALLLVIVGAATSQTDMAVPKACCQAVVCTAALVSEGCTWQHLCCSALLLVIVPLCEQHTFTKELAVTQACCLLSALFCTAALISEGCILSGSVLPCTVAGHRAFV